MLRLLCVLSTYAILAGMPAIGQSMIIEESEEGPTLYVEEVGTSDSVVVVLHGGPGLSHDYLRPEWDRLLESGYRVVYYDQRGCGRSGDRAPYTLSADVADLRRVIAHVSGQGRRLANRIIESIDLVSIDERLPKALALEIRDGRYISEFVRRWIGEFKPVDYDAAKHPVFRFGSFQDRGFGVLTNLDFDRVRLHCFENAPVFRAGRERQKTAD